MMRFNEPMRGLLKHRARVARWPVAWGLALTVVGAGCSLVLDDPLAFQVRGAGQDAERNDAAPVDASVFIDQNFAAEADQGLRVPQDGGQRIDAQVDPCSGPEICNGRDDNCNGLIDENPVGQCEECEVPGAIGACQRGVFYCFGGQLICVPRPPIAQDIVACNLVDDNCDGLVDEPGEGEIARDALARSAMIACGPPLPEPSTHYGACDEPNTVGCGPVHACLEPSCLDRCEQNHLNSNGACERSCQDDRDPMVQSSCLAACRQILRQDREACMATCPAGQATRFSCEEGAAGPDCVALDCPEGLVADGRDCVPAAARQDSAPIEPPQDAEVEEPDADLGGPDAEVEAPDAEVEGPDAEVEAPDAGENDA